MNKLYFDEQKATTYNIDKNKPANIKTDTKENDGMLSKILNGAKTDDLILLCVIVFLLLEKCPDKELLIVLGFLLVSG